ncbi:MAG: hypothetical protein ACODAE_06590 [Gemmatimonadota bacterium]
MSRFRPSAAGPVAILLYSACTAAACAAQDPANRSSADESMGVDEEVARDIERIRTATAAFRSLDSAVAAGYSRDGGACLDNPPEGAMGYHHVNEALLDDRIEVERPEMLVYERLPDGEYRLNGVEYIVPFSAVPPTAEPPTVMGRPLRASASLEIWYRHVWVWRDNPSGMFADWNPNVEC